jgi:hypothetical protein
LTPPDRFLVVRSRRNGPFKKAATMLRNSCTIPVACLILAALGLLGPGPAPAAESGFTQYVDPGKRITFEYPLSMKVEAPGMNEVKISHPEAGLRIMVFVENRPRKTAPSAEAFLGTFRKRLEEEMKEVVILEEGKLPGLAGSQAYVICAFKDRRGLQFVNLVQYYGTEERMLQMIISERPEGFRNLLDVIRKIHQSLRILSPQLK